MLTEKREKIRRIYFRALIALFLVKLLCVSLCIMKLTLAGYCCCYCCSKRTFCKLDFWNRGKTQSRTVLETKVSNWIRNFNRPRMSLSCVKRKVSDVRIYYEFGWSCSSSCSCSVVLYGKEVKMLISVDALTYFRILFSLWKIKIKTQYINHTYVLRIYIQRKKFGSCKIFYFSFPSFSFNLYEKFILHDK